MAEHSSSTPKRGAKIGAKAGKTQPPITRHRLFPAVAALWGAALPFAAGLVFSAVFLRRILPMTGHLGLALLLALAGGWLAFRAAGKAGQRGPVSAPRTDSAAPVVATPAPAPIELPPEAEPEDISLAYVPVTAPPPVARPVFDVADFTAAWPSSPEPERQPEAAEIVEPELAAEPAPGAPAPAGEPIGKAARRLVSADLGALSDLELIERLALALQRWRTAGGDVPIAPPAGLFEAADPAPGAAAVLAALAPARTAPAAAPAISPVAASFVRSLPGGAGADPQDTEAALRNALASLRQMSGAA